jgi:excisionase family DNA binding protein
MSDEPLDLAQAARRLGISTREVVVLVDEGKIRYVIYRGMPHIRPEALEDYRKAS